MLAELRRRGPLLSRDLDDRALVPWQTGGWNDGKNLSMLLEFLWGRGEILVSAREGGERVWDLAERVLPQLAAVERLEPWEGLRGLRPDPVAGSRASRDRRRGSGAPPVSSPSAAMLERVEIEGRRRRVVRASRRPRGRRAASRGVTLLSPFDPLIRDRERALALWDFDFRLEIYVPKAKRRYGYFVLPVLDGDELVGRIDPLFDRASRTARRQRGPPRAGPDAAARRAARGAGAIPRRAEVVLPVYAARYDGRHGLRDARDPRRPGARPDDGRGDDADLPDLDLRAGGGRRPQGLRLLAHRQPDAHGARDLPREPRGRRRTATPSRPGSARRRRSCTSLSPGDRVVTVNDVYGGTYRMFSQVYEPKGYEFAFVPPDELAARDRRADAARLARDADEPAAEHRRHPRGRGRRPRRRRARSSSTTPSPRRTSSSRSRSAPTSSSTRRRSTSAATRTSSAASRRTNDPTIAERLRFLQKSLGAVPGPFDAWLVLRGVKTLAVRMQRHCENARAVAAFLEAQPAGRARALPRPPGHPGHELAATADARLRRHDLVPRRDRGGGRRPRRAHEDLDAGREPRRRREPDRAPRADDARVDRRRARSPRRATSCACRSGSSRRTT